MSLLTRSAPPDGAATAAPLASPLAVGALAAVQALVGSLLCVIAPVIAVWIASTRTDATWSEALRVAADAWLLAHHTGIAVDGGHVALIPLGLTLLPAAWCWAGGRRISAALGAAAPRGTRRRALAAFAAVYALAAAVVSLLAASPVARPLSGQALLGAGVLAATAAGFGLLRGPDTAGRRAGLRDVLARLAARLPLPPVVRRVLPAACVATAAWLAAGAAVLAAALTLHWTGVRAAHDALRAGPVGGLGLTLVQLALIPVAVIWAASWAAGPGFAVGTGTVVNPWVADLGALPALPLLAALPNGALPGAVQGVLAVPVLAGALAGWWLRRRGRADADPAERWWRRAVVEGTACGAVTGVAAAALAWLATGPVGSGRMAVAGPEWWLVGLVMAVEVTVGCAAVLAFPARRRRQPPSSPGTLGSRLRSSIHRS